MKATVGILLLLPACFLGMMVVYAPLDERACPLFGTLCFVATAAWLGWVVFGIARPAHLQTTLAAVPAPASALHPLGSRTGILLASAWLYFFGWGLLVAGNALLCGGFELIVMTCSILVPVVSIPLYLVHCVREHRAVRFFPWLPWVGRVMVVSIILAMCDVWVVSTEHSAPALSRFTWKLKDGGTSRYVGFGYSLTNYRQIGGSLGPEVWFWFTPFTISWTSGHMRVGLPWQSP